MIFDTTADEKRITSKPEKRDTEGEREAAAASQKKKRRDRSAGRTNLWILAKQLSAVPASSIIWLLRSGGPSPLCGAVACHIGWGTDATEKEKYQLRDCDLLSKIQNDVI